MKGKAAAKLSMDCEYLLYRARIGFGRWRKGWKIVGGQKEVRN
jgi:hypothetical protein